MIDLRLTKERTDLEDRLVYPAPIVSGVALGSDVSGEESKHWDAVIDTGANQTVIPLEAAETLYPDSERAIFGNPVAVELPNGVSVECKPYPVVLTVPGIGRAPVMALAMERNSILIGMNYLLQADRERGEALSPLVLILDGVSRKWWLGEHNALTRWWLRLLNLRIINVLC